MVIADLRTKHVFPRIPLNLTLPEEYPDIGNISSVSIVPEIKHMRLGRNELEIKGSYLLTISYFGPGSDTGAGQSGDKERGDEFFSFLKVQSNGFLNEDETDLGFDDNPGDLYTVDFSRLFHTFIDLYILERVKNFKPVMVVEKVNISSSGPRNIKGELVLGIVNAGRDKRR